MIRNIIKAIVDRLIYIESIFHSNKKHSTKRKVLILRKDGLGDCIIFYPLLSHYREYFKNCELTLVYPKYFEDLAPLLKNMDNVIWFDHKKFSSNILYRRSFLISLKTAGYDTAIYPVFSREKIGDFMMKMTGSSHIIGYNGDSSIQGEKNKKRGDKIYTRLIQSPSHTDNEFERNIFFAEQIINKRLEVPFPTININDIPEHKTQEIIRMYGLINKKFSIIFPGSGAIYKIWPSERFAECIDHITDKGIIPVICGSKNEVNLTKEIVRKSKTKSMIVNLAGNTDLATLSHLIYRCEFYFGSDTSILHLAVGLGKPTVAIVGSGSYGRFFPYGNKEKNITVFDLESTRKYPKGMWEKMYYTSIEPHPSIQAIKTEQAKEKIDQVINLIK